MPTVHLVLTRQACHYDLYKALGATFQWVTDNIALRLQDVEDQFHGGQIQNHSRGAGTAIISTVSVLSRIPVPRTIAFEAAGGRCGS